MTTRREAQGSPEARARMTAVLAAPAVRAKMSAGCKRAWARRAVTQAGLPLLRRHVDRAVDLFAAGEPRDLVVETLREEAR